ncbi:serine protease [Brucepastera parasyntrophica]|uniref:S1C family serine protease n=1 Tax=Brucepastera parasyntrophica TaxID=2880008 RepID=UPI00210EB4D9|nr:serine protease [Brucepastera parasyntrophica]ULQ58588.1 serine protease [Brucepastera parasyntrophica]
MFKRSILCTICMLIGFSAIAQSGSLRDYVGLINQTYHPDIADFMNKFKEEFEKEGKTDAAKGIENFLKGGYGSGFVYVDSKGDNYIITNYHVVSQSYTLTITFEARDGTKTKYEDLRIIAVDEDTDIAILGFPDGKKPFSQGLRFLTRPLDEGEDVYSAGFPGIGGYPLWQLGKGIVSNAFVKIPINDDETIGPFIQHTAQIDAGNSGGPLLVQAPGVPTGYVVAGINTLSARWRQATNYSIPIDEAEAFIKKALNPDSDNPENDLKKRIDAFIEDASLSEDIYIHIAKYLSNACIAQNAEYALVEVIEKAPKDTREAIIVEFAYFPVDGMHYAVAWLIENSLRAKKGGGIAISFDSLSETDDGTYTVNFTVNGNSVTSNWKNEYGLWRINTFGTVASGDKALMAAKEKEWEQSSRLKTKYWIMASLGYTQVLDRGPALNAALKLNVIFTDLGIGLYYGGKDFSIWQFTFGYRLPIRLGSFALMPFIDAGFGVLGTRDEDGDKGQYFGFVAHGGLYATLSAVPGLFFGASFQFNAFDLLSRYDSNDINKTYDRYLINISIGYGF